MRTRFTSRLCAGHWLVVAEDQLRRTAAMRALHDIGATCDAATDGVDALRRLTPPYRFDAVLMHADMATMDGFETARRIRDAEVAGGVEPIPIVLVTSGVARPVLTAGMSAMIKTPVRKQALREAINSLLAG